MQLVPGAGLHWHFLFNPRTALARSAAPSSELLAGQALTVLLEGISEGTPLCPTSLSMGIT